MPRTFGVTKSPTEVSNFIEHQVKVNLENVSRGKPKYTVCIWGEKGIGKTDIVKQLQKKEVVKWVIPLSLGQIEEAGDIHGLPVKAEAKDGRLVTITAPPSWVPVTDEPGIILFDDFNRADIRIIRGFMQLLQDGTTINWSLPPKWTIALTANPENSDYQVTELDPAMLTRVVHITMKPDTRSWLAWAEEYEVDSRVQSFIARYSEHLAPPNAERTCPRTWVMFADLIRDIPDLKVADRDLIVTYGCAVLDDESVTNFISFVDNELDWVVDPDIICEQYTTNPQVRERVLAPIKENRVDIIRLIFERLLGYLTALKTVTRDSRTAKNVIALLEEETLSKDIKYIYTNAFTDATSDKVVWLSSDKLGRQLRTVLV